MAARPTPDSLAMIERLVGFDTTSRNSNLELIHWIRDHLAGLGVAAELVHDETGAKANLYATLGPTDRGGIMLSGHTDVVPIDGQEWSTDAFRVTERDGRLYGRGTTDMKSFVAVALAMTPEFLRRGLETPIHLAFSYDEEVGCLGVRRMIAEVARRPVKPVACIVGEPTEMQVIVAHKGKLSLRCDVRGFECHSSLAHAGVNAVEAAAEAVAHLKAMARRMRDRGPYDAAFDPPYTTVHTGLIQGGTALNIVPKDCEIDFEIRVVPPDDPDALVAELAEAGRRLAAPARARGFPAAVEVTAVNSYPGLETSPDEAIVALARAASGSNATVKLAFGTEGGLFQKRLRLPTVVCGPGSIDRAHKPDEYVTRDELAQCDAFLARVVERLA